VSEEQLHALPVEALYVGTDGSSAAIERARTTIETTLPFTFAPSTLGNVSPQSAQLLAGWRQLASVAIIASLPIAGCSLAVAVAAGLVDRKRPFSLLRLSGAPLALLRRVVALEAALPLLVVAVLSAGTGLAAAHLFLRAQLGESLRSPTLEYYVVVTAGLGLSFAVIGSTLPLLDRITGPEVARND
jgi:predicted lysophospholipase L1 biosynthesis ABC-type transport system permease subunit